MASYGEIHAWNKAQYGSMKCGCSYYHVEVMGCDHDCYPGEEATETVKPEPVTPTKEIPF